MMLIGIDNLITITLSGWQLILLQSKPRDRLRKSQKQPKKTPITRTKKKQVIAPQCNMSSLFFYKFDDDDRCYR